MIALMLGTVVAEPLVSGGESLGVEFGGGMLRDADTGGGGA
jgi:hypothetical protein